MNGTDAKQSAGYFREKAIIGLSSLSGDEIDKALMKVTSHMLKAPKEKYMQSLLAASYGHLQQRQKHGLPINEYIIRELDKRSHTHNWIIVLKTYVVFHRLMTDGSDDMLEMVCRYHNVFSPSNIKELGDTNAGASQKFFIEEYMRYLEERAVAQGPMGYCRRVERSEFDDYMNSLNAEALMQPFESLLSMLLVLAQIHYREAVVDNFVTFEAYNNLIRDGKRLFQLLSKRIIFILNGFEDLPLPLKVKWLALYKRYDTAAKDLKVLFDSISQSSRTFQETIPQLKPLPDSLMRQLEQDVEMSKSPPRTETLASLGIKSEDSRVVKEERLPGVESPKKPAPSPVPQTPPTVAASPTAVAPQPAKPAFSMDDLFQAAPAAAPQPQVQQSWFDGSNAAPAGGSDGWSTGAPADGASGWGSGAPTNDGWSTGAPAQTGFTSNMPPEPQGFNPSAQYAPAQPPQQAFDNYGAGNPTDTQQQQASMFSGPPATQAQRAPKPNDPFKDLYNKSQQQWQ